MMGTVVTNIAWLPPESYPDLAPGQYRTVAPGGDPLDGDLVVWVDEALNDPGDGSGHFELYEGDPAVYEYSTRFAYLRELRNQEEQNE